MRAIGPVHKKVAKGGEGHIGLARTLLGQVEKHIAQSNGLIKNFANKIKTPDGWDISVGVVGGQRYLHISGVSVEEKEITGPGNFRFTPWESNCPDAVIIKKDKGLWEIEIINRDAGERVNGESEKQYLSFHYDAYLGDYFNAYGFDNVVYKDGWQIFSHWRNVIGATVYKGYFVIITQDVRYATELVIWYASAIDLVTTENKNSFDWIELTTFWDNGEDYKTISPIIFALGGNVGNFISFKVDEDGGYTQRHHTITLNKILTDFSASIEDVIVSRSRYNYGYNNDPEGTYVTGISNTEINEYWYPTYSYPPGGDTVNGICAGSIGAAKAWCDEEAKSYECRSTQGFYPVYAGHIDPPPCNTDMTFGFSTCYICYSAMGYSHNLNAGSTSTSYETTLVPTLSSAALVAGEYKLGFYSVTSSTDVYGYDFISGASGYVRGPTASDCVPESARGRLINFLFTNQYLTKNRNYAGGSMSKSYKYSWTGLVGGDFDTYKYNLSSGCTKVGFSYTSPGPALGTPTDNACQSGNMSPLTAPDWVWGTNCTSEETYGCGPYTHQARGFRNEEEIKRYVPLFAQGAYIETSYSFGVALIPVSYYVRRGAIGQEKQDITITHNLKLVVGGSVRSLPSFTPWVEEKINVTVPVSSAGSSSSASSDSTASLWYKSEPSSYSYFSMIADLQGNMLISMFLADPEQPDEDWVNMPIPVARLIYDKEVNMLIDITPLYNTAIIVYNDVNGTNYNQLAATITPTNTYSNNNPMLAMGVL